MCPFVSIFALPLTLPPHTLAYISINHIDRGQCLRDEDVVEGAWREQSFRVKKKPFFQQLNSSTIRLYRTYEIHRHRVSLILIIFSEMDSTYTHSKQRRDPHQWDGGILYLDNMNLHKEFPIIIESGRGTLSSCLTISSSFGASSSSYTCPGKNGEKYIIIFFCFPHFSFNLRNINLFVT